MRNRTSIAALLFLLTLPIAFANTFGASWPIKDGRGLAPITSPFGARCISSGDYHAGMDVRTWSCNKVAAVAAGTVYRVTSYTGYDGSIILRHGASGSYWYSGYHHLSSDSILVTAGTTVSAGQIIAKAGPADHLHFNYWLATPADADIDANTSHPLRSLGASGEFSIRVSCACYPYSALDVQHCGQLLEAGVGIGFGPYSYPFWTYVWNYEGNVRAYATTFGSYAPGDCYIGATSSIGISPTSFNADGASHAYFVFPAVEGNWILNNSLYTYALSTNGSRITIESPVSDFFQDVIAKIDNSEVIIEWTVSSDKLSNDGFAIFKGMARESMGISDMSVSQTDERSFRTIDPAIEAGETYYYRIEYRGDAGAFSAETIEITVPGAKGQVSISPPWPNPFRENAGSVCFVPVQKQFDVSVYDVSGRLVKSILSGSASGDEFAVAWDGTNNQGRRVSEGCYFLRLYVKGYPATTEKIFLLK